MEVVKADEEVDDSMLELAKELFKSVLYAITDIETFQPRPKRITVVSRVYRLLAVKSTTPEELFSRKVSMACPKRHIYRRAKGQKKFFRSLNTPKNC